VLDEREGLTSCTLFFLERPPADRAVDELGLLLSEGRTGDDSLEGNGLFAADGVGVRLGGGFFVVVVVVRIEDAEESRTSLDAVGFVWLWL
jgi:hypothetical protein